MKRYILIAVSAFALSGLVASPALANKANQGHHGKQAKPGHVHHQKAK
jgi:hypothetical protein